MKTKQQLIKEKEKIPQDKQMDNFVGICQIIGIIFLVIAGLIYIS